MMYLEIEIVGLYVNAAHDIFRKLDREEHDSAALYVSYFEIYGGVLFDLLNERKKLVPREDNKKKVQIVGLEEHRIDDVGSFLELIDYGNSIRSTGMSKQLKKMNDVHLTLTLAAATGANVDSSRSHAILQIVLKNRRNEKEIGRPLVAEITCGVTVL